MFKPNKNIEKVLEKVLEESLEDACDILVDKAKQNAPVDSGNLKNSLKKEKKEKLRIKVGTDVEYASYVEFGTFKQSANPFFRSAIKESSDKMLKQFRRKLK